MKKGPLSKKEKAYITKNHENMTVRSMAGTMDRSVHMVDKYIATLGKETKVESAETPTPTSEPNQLYARNVAENGVVRSTIGTQAASMAADESRSKRKENQTGVAPRMNQHIHIIKKG